MPRQPSLNFDITERLIHLELADLACHRVYLDPKWPDVNEPPVPADAVRPKAAKGLNPAAAIAKIKLELATE